MSIVTFTGYYGMQNYGDDLFAMVSAFGAHKWWPGSQPRILAPRIAGQGEVYSIPGFVTQRLYSRMDAVGKVIRAGFSLGEMTSRGRVVFSGGSLFTSNRSRIFELLAPLAGMRRKSFAAIGVSIGPFDSVASERQVASFLRRFDYICVRDRASFDVLKGFPLEARVAMGRDLAGLVPDVAGTTPRRPAMPCIGYSSCNSGKDPQAAVRFDDLFVESVRRRPGLEVRIFNLNSHPVLGDMQRSEYVHARLARAGVQAVMLDYSRTGLLEVWRAIGECSAMVSMRLHGAISAYVLGVPFMLYEYHRKCTDFLDDIGQPPGLRISVEAADTMERQLDLLLSGAVPGLSRHAYSKEAAAQFLQAPWAAPA